MKICYLCGARFALAARSTESETMARARDLGIPFFGTPGPCNAITDVAGVEVGHQTIISDRNTSSTHRVRTGVTVIHPRGRNGFGGVAAGRSALNGTGEWTGMHVVDEIGRLYGPIALTGTSSLGIVHRTLAEWSSALNFLPEDERYMRLLAVVGETLDSQLNDVFGPAIPASDVIAAIEGARGGDVAEGNVGGGTGMAAYEFKGGIGTASRVVTANGHSHRVGVLLQTNHGRRSDLVIAGVPVGREITDLLPHSAHGDEAAPFDGRRDERTKSSLLITIATDAALMPHQLQRMARRAAMGIARCGSTANNLSGEMTIAFSTAQLDAPAAFVSDLDSDSMNGLFAATVECVEEALVNQLVASTDMTGHNDVTLHAIPHDKLLAILAKHGRLTSH